MVALHEKKISRYAIALSASDGVAGYLFLMQSMFPQLQVVETDRYSLCIAVGKDSDITGGIGIIATLIHIYLVNVEVKGASGSDNGNGVLLVVARIERRIGILTANQGCRLDIALRIRREFGQNVGTIGAETEAVS